MGVSKDWGQLTSTNALAPVAIATDTTTLTTALDSTPYRKLSFIITSGVVTDGTYTPILQSSATSGGTYADDDAIMSAWSVVGASDDGAVWEVAVDLDAVDQPFLKVEITSATTTTGALLSVVAVGELMEY
jgi:hypothetical protein